ncbi:MAG: hypothetical protein WC713_08535 [Candidatus Methylomirabilota bacterium]
MAKYTHKMVAGKYRNHRNRDYGKMEVPNRQQIKINARNELYENTAESGEKPDGGLESSVKKEGF